MKESTNCEQDRLTKLLHQEANYIHKYNTPSISINKLICEQFKIQPQPHNQHMQHHINTLNNFIHNKYNKAQVWCEWITILMFNIVAINQQYIQEIISMSTQSIDQIVVKLLSENACTVTKAFIQMDSISNIINQHKHKQLMSMLESMDYVIAKMKIQTNMFEIIHNKMKEIQAQGEQDIVGSQYIEQVNRVMFSQDSVEQVSAHLQTNYNTDLISIVRLLDANFYNMKVDRDLFRQTQISGSKFVDRLLTKIIRQTNKKYLFGDKHNSVLMQLVMTLFEYKYVGVYLSWLQILQQMLRKDDIRMYRQKIPKFITALTYQDQYDEFSYFINMVYRQLMGVHNQNKQVCLQVIKKLLLNRILLNPVYYYAYSLAFPKVPSQKLVSVLNKIRVMFYASKVPSQYKSINEIYEDRIGNFVSHRKQKYNNKGIYILDKYLYNNYVHIHCDLNLKQENKEKRAISISDESYSLSFSFVKNSKVTTNKPKNVKENTVQNTMDDIKSPPKSPTYLGSPKGKTVKTEHTQLTNESHTHKKKTQRDDMDLLMELVQRRRKLGAFRRNIDVKKQQRIRKRQKLDRFLTQVHYEFTKNRREIEKSANIVRLQVELL